MSTGPTHQAGCSFFNPDITAPITCSLLLGGFLGHEHDVRKWIEGFN